MYWKAKKLTAYLCILFGLFLSSNLAHSQDHVDLNIVIAIDCSYSVDQDEFNLQVHGTAAAFTNPDVIRAITSGKYGKIAVSVVQWSTTTSQVITVPWTVVTDQIDAYKLAIAIKTQTRQTSEGGTSISAVLKKSTIMLLTAPNSASRMVIDIASDGENNSGARVEPTRDAILKRGITINGLTILNEVGYLNYYFQNRVIGGDGAFVQIAKSYRDFGEAIRKKILREILGGSLS